MEQSKRRLIFLAAALLAASLLALGLGSVSFNPAQLLNGLQDPASLAGRILWHVRGPRVLAGLLGGAALAAAGYIIQAVLANNLASPSVIGINSGAGLGAALCCALFPYSFQLVPAAAFVFALLAAILIVSLAQKSQASRITIVLAGLAVSQLFAAGTDLILTFVPDALSGYTDFRIGGLANVTMARLVPGAIMIVIGLGAAFMLAVELDVLTLGTESAAALGLNVKVCNFLLLLAAAMLCAGAISFCGLLSFVGLIVPHITRRLIKEQGRLRLLACMLAGSLLLITCDLAARTLFVPFELPVGIFLAFIGAPFFLWLLIQNRSRKI